MGIVTRLQAFSNFKDEVQTRAALKAQAQLREQKPAAPDRVRMGGAREIRGDAAVFVFAGERKQAIVLFCE